MLRAERLPKLIPVLFAADRIDDDDVGGSIRFRKGSETILDEGRPELRMFGINAGLKLVKNRGPVPLVRCPHGRRNF